MADVSIGEADIEVEADTSNFERDLRRSLSRVGGTIGGLKNAFTGMGNSFAETASGMKGSIFLIAAAISLLPAVGALAATALVLAFGGAFAAIGLMVAKSNKGVEKHMESLGKHVKKVM